MGVGVQSEPRGKMTKHTGHGLNVHAVLESEGSEGVTEVMEPDLRDSGSFQNTLEHIVHAVWGYGATIGGGGAIRAPPVAEKAR